MALLAAAVSGCHEAYSGWGAAALDGAYRGVVLDVDAAHASGEMLILDGLILGYDYDRKSNYSATL